MASASRLSEARRCFSLLALVFLLVTLFGSHLPWMQISEENKTHQWQISEQGGQSGQASFKLDMFFNMLSLEACQTFREDSPFYYNGQAVCSVMPFQDAHKYTVDGHDWSPYVDSCHSAGMVTFALVIAAVSVMLLIVIVTAFKNFQRKCCPQIYEAQHGAAKYVIPSCAAIAPICAAVGILLYFVQCINFAKGQNFVKANNAADVQRIATGYQGFWMAIAGSFCMLFWWILFTVWFCNKSVASVTFEDNSELAASQKRPIAQDSDDEDSRMSLQAVQS